MRIWPLVLAAMFLAPKIAAQEGFPGQNDLAAGLSCHANLDLECARDRLEKALAEFSPEQDVHYLEHVCSARQVLAFIAVANDDLQAAEREFVTLLLLNPEFELPPGDQPPKVRYVFGQARDTVARQHKKPEPPLEGKKPDAQTGKPPEILRPVGPPAEESPEESRLRLHLAAETRLVALFGRDAEAAASGPGAALSLGLSPVNWLALDLTLAYAHHVVANGQPSLQAFSLTAECQVPIAAGPVHLRLGAGLGSLAMGTKDRYDTWGFLLQGLVGASWPRRGPVAVLLLARPSLLATRTGSSFFLPVGLALELRWPSL